MGVFTSKGELLIDPHSTLVASSLLPVADTVTVHSVRLDDDPALLGTSLYVQGAIGRGDGTMQLCNSEVLVVGCAP